MTQKNINIPEIPDDTIHPKNPDIKWLGKVILLISGFGIFTYIFLLFFSFLITLEITIDEEKEIFTYAELEYIPHYIPNWEEIIDYEIEIPHNIQVYIIDSPEINAYARLGGYIIFTTGIINNFSNQEEFLYVLGHELTHVQERHMIRSIAFTSPLKLMMSYVGLGSGIDFDEIIKVGGFYLNRKDEYSADVGGVKYVQKHGGNPQCASIFFSDEENNSKSTFSKYLSTHPEDTKRKFFLDQYDTKMPCKEIIY